MHQPRSTTERISLHLSFPSKLMANRAACRSSSPRTKTLTPPTVSLSDFRSCQGSILTYQRRKTSLQWHCSLGCFLLRSGLRLPHRASRCHPEQGAAPPPGLRSCPSNLWHRSTIRHAAPAARVPLQLATSLQPWCPRPLMPLLTPKKHLTPLICFEAGVSVFVLSSATLLYPAISNVFCSIRLCLFSRRPYRDLSSVFPPGSLLLARMADTIFRSSFVNMPLC